MKKNILIAAAITLGSQLYAQTGGQNAVVNVENDYAPVVIEVNKRGFTPTLDTDIETTPLELVFSKQAQPYTTFTSDRDAREFFPRLENPYSGYARLGYGLTNDIDAKLGYTLKTSRRGKMDMLAAFDGFRTDIDGVYREWNSRMFRSLVKADYSHEFDGLSLGVSGEFNNRVFNYQDTGDNMTLDTDKQNSRNYGLHATGVSHLAGPFAYTFNGGFTYNRRSNSSGADGGTGEVGLNIGGSFVYDINAGGVENVGIETDINGFIYNGTLRDAYYGFTNYTSFDVNPFLNFNFNGWKMKVGTRMNFVTANAARFAIAPDLKIEGNINKRVSIYAGIGGGRTNNSLTGIERISPYWGFDERTGRQLKPTYRVTDIKAGARISLEPVSFDIFAGYTYTKDDLLQYTENSGKTPQYALIYANLFQANTHNTFIGGRVGCDFRGWLKASAGARYDYWSCDNKDLLVMKPMFTMDVTAEARFFEDLTIKAGYTFAYYTKGETNGRINNRNELNLRAGYRIFDWLSAYIQGENLLDSEYFEYAGYLTRGARGSIGATFNF